VGKKQIRQEEEGRCNTAKKNGKNVSQEDRNKRIYKETDKQIGGQICT
jgi:hypothetical protein